jgi:hypothetical protein
MSSGSDLRVVSKSGKPPTGMADDLADDGDDDDDLDEVE